MYLSELQTKDIVSVLDGRRLGRIIDAEINEEGRIISLIIEAKKGIKNFISNSNDTKIKYEDISKIGADVILVNI